ncbi:MAG: O-antigen ligase family protein [Solirubrobacteraceae bacterium]
MIPFVLAAVPAVIALLLWSIVDLEKFVLFAVLGAMIVPASLAKPGGANVAGVDVLLLVALASWLILNSIGRASDPWVKKNPLVKPALLFVAVSAASLAWSIKPRSTFVFTIQLIEITIMFPLVFATLPRSVANIRKAFVLLIALTSVMALATLAVYAAHPSTHTQGTYLPGLNKNAIGTFVTAGAVLAYALLIGSERTGPRALLALLLALDVGGLVASGSRGATIGAGAAVLAVSFLLGRRRLLAVGVMAALAVVYLAVIGPSAAKKADASGGYDSSVVRQYAWEGAIKKIEQRPFFGTGGKTYTDTLPQLDGFVTSDPLNLFLLTWAELGIAGMAALIYLLCRFGQLLARARRLPREAAVLAVGAGGVAISLIAHFQFDVSWTRGTTSLEFAMMGLMVALTRLSTPNGDLPAAEMLGAPVASEAPVSLELV